MKTLIDLFKQFRKEDEKIAMIYRTGVRRFTFTYGDLDILSRKMAQWLATKGVSSGDRVLLWAPNSPWWAVAFWGIIARGAVVVPVDFISGKERALGIKKASGSELIIQSQYKLEKIDGDRTFFIEDLEYILSSLEPTEHFPAKDEHDIAELVFTSGTTGDPKGVILTNKNLMTNLQQIEQHIQFNGTYNFLSVLPLSHMFEQMAGFLVPLHKGCRIVYLKVLKPSALMEALKEENIYILVLVPRLLQALRNSIERKFESKNLDKIFRSLLIFSSRLPRTLKNFLFFPVQKSFGNNFKFFVSGGSSLDSELFGFWGNMGFAVLEGYGLSECSPVLTANSLEKQVPGSVGTALNGIEIKIDHDEILVKGDNVFFGYWNNEPATKAAFTADGWFKTGDLGYFDESKNLFIKGRSKDIIITGAGINVYPEEIEQELNKIEGVLESCVVGLDTGEGEEVHAVLLLKPGAENPEKIIEKMNMNLDPTQQITGFMIWPKLDFPKTPTLKIQKFKVKALLATRRIESDDSEVDLLIRLIAKTTAKDPKEIKEESVLVAGLGLTSVGRLELTSYIEQEFRLDIEDTAIKQNTRVRDLREMIQKRERYEEKDRLRMWTNALPVRIIRTIVEYCLHIPLRKFFMSTTVEGAENLKGFTGPALFISNHVSYFDLGVIVYALPIKIRSRIATAAWEEFFFESGRSFFEKLLRRFFFEYSTIFFNVFMIPQSRGFRKTLGFMGKLIDRNVNILYFPEGSRTWDGNMLPFEAGLGIVVKELKVPVVPVKLEGLLQILPRGAAFPKRGPVTVKFGVPLYFTNESPGEINKIAQNTIENL